MLPITSIFVAGVSVPMPSESWMYVLPHTVAVAGVVDRATSLALKRDIELGKNTGVGQDDIMQAIADVLKENRNLTFIDEINDLANSMRATVIVINK